jgi:iron complex transport system permease protein
VDDAKVQLREGYHRYTFRKILFIALCIALAIIAAGYAATLGAREIAFFDVYRIIFDHIGGMTYEIGSIGWIDDYVIWNQRLPRILMALVAGAGLAIGGAAMQSLIKNPLADPYTTGISSGAVFGVTVALVLGMSFASSISQYGIVLNAFLLGLAPVGVIVLVSRVNNASPATMILAGIALSYLFRSLSTLLMVSTDADTVAAAYLWQIGTLENASWSGLPLMFCVTAAGSLFLMFTSRQLNILTLGDESAKSLGLNADNYRVLCLVLIAVMTAAVISFTGIIGFIGLVSPHVVRSLIGSDNKYVIPASMAFGAMFLLLADIVARTVIAPSELPVGIIMSFIGGPLFLYIIIRQKREVW